MADETPRFEHTLSELRALIAALPPGRVKPDFETRLLRVEEDMLAFQMEVEMLRERLDAIEHAVEFVLPLRRQPSPPFIAALVGGAMLATWAMLAGIAWLGLPLPLP